MRYKPKPYDKYFFAASAVLIVVIIALLAFPRASDPSRMFCVLNGTEYYYWNEQTKQGFIVSEPETACRSIYGNANEAWYWCDDIHQGFTLTSPPTDFRLIRIVEDTCVKWEETHWR